MSEPTLDERIAAAQADLATAEGVTARYAAAGALDRLNAQKLVEVMQARDARDLASRHLIGGAL